MRIHTRKQYVLGIDVGGQSLKAALYARNGGRLDPVSKWQGVWPTVKGVKGHCDQVTQIIAQAQQWITRQDGILEGIGIGSPGRFKNGVIAPGTNAHMGLYHHEFDQLHLQSRYEQALGRNFPPLASVPLYVGNDADAMLAGMVGAIMNAPAALPESDPAALKDQHGREFSKASLAGRRVGLFGIGTGVAHAIADVGENGSLAFVTDGHASKLMIKVDDEDVPRAKELIRHFAGLPPESRVAIPNDDAREVMAEYLFCDPVVRALAGVETGPEIDPEHHPRHAEALAFAGKYMGRVIAAIRSGKSRDHRPENGWSDQDRAEAAKTGIYLIGGGMGRGEKTGPALIAHAQRELRRQGIDDIRLVQVTGGNSDMYAAYAAASLVPAQRARGAVAGK